MGVRGMLRIVPPWVWWRDTLHTGPGTLVAILPWCIWPSIPSWDHPAPTINVLITSNTAGCPVTARGAQEWELPWMRALLLLPVLKGVKVGIVLCAELLRLSGGKRMNDWIARGSPTVISLWLRHAAQSGALSVPPLMAGMLRKVVSVRHQNVRNVPEW